MRGGGFAGAWADDGCGAAKDVAVARTMSRKERSPVAPPAREPAELAGAGLESDHRDSLERPFGWDGWSSGEKEWDGTGASGGRWAAAVAGLGAAALAGLVVAGAGVAAGEGLWWVGGREAPGGGEENYSHGMEQKHGKNWKVDHPQLDVAVVYERVGRTPHGRLAIADEAISITEKEEIKTRKRNALPHVSARELRLERENDSLKRDNNRLRGRERVMRVMAAKGGMDYDALLEEAAPDMVTSESEVGFSREHDRVDQDRTKRQALLNLRSGYLGSMTRLVQDGIEQDNLGHDGDEEYVNDDEDYGHDGDDYCDNGGYYGLEDDDYYDNGGGYYGHEGDDDYDHY
ncbi:hypothetical protein ACP70R_000190 [Stipagrostis hirtigluma subsp. patula]